MTDMNLGMTERLKPIHEKVRAMVRDEILPLDEEFHSEIGKNGDRWSYTPRMTEILEGLKAKARERGLWNFWLTDSERGYGLTTVEYAYLAEEMGKAHLGAETFNCSAPDTGNMEVLERYASEAHKDRWLAPLLEGRIRSAYLMTEPDVASSDATNIAMSCVRDGDEYVLNGEKWWSSGAGDPRCAIYITMVKTSSDAPKHSQHSMILVPADTPGITKLRAMTVYGDDDAPHGHLHIRFEDVRVPAENLLLGEGRGFEIAPGTRVIVVEDIVDSGLTLQYLLDNLQRRSPQDITVVALLKKDKPDAVQVQVDKVGFTIPDEFVIGYGLDYAGKYRNLPYVAVLDPSVYAPD